MTVSHSRRSIHSITKLKVPPYTEAQISAWMGFDELLGEFGGVSFLPCLLTLMSTNSNPKF